MWLKPKVRQFELGQLNLGPAWAWVAVFLVLPALFLWAISHYGDGGILVSGKVVDESGRPVADALVKLQPPVDSDIELFANGERKTFEDGVFGFCPTFRPQRALFTLTVAKPGYQSVSKGGFEAPNGYKDIILVLRPIDNTP